MKRTVCLLLGGLLLGGSAACAKPNGKPMAEREEIIRDFESFGEVVHGVTVSEYFGEWDINFDSRYVTHGGASLKIRPEGNYRAWEVPAPYLRISPNMSQWGESFSEDFRKVKQISFDVYNTAEEDRELAVRCSYLTDRLEWGTPITVDGEKETFQLKPGWNRIEYEYDRSGLIDRYPIDNLHNIDFIFDIVEKDREVPEFYLDRLALTLDGYDNYIRFDMPASVTRGASVKLNAVTESFDGRAVPTEMEYRIFSDNKEIAVHDNVFRADAEGVYTVEARAKSGGKIVAENRFTVRTREKQHYGVIDDLNDWSDGMAVINKIRRGEFMFDAEAERADGTKGALAFRQTKIEAGFGFRYQDVWAYKESLAGFEVEMNYQSQKSMNKVPVFKGLFRDDGVEYLMYKSEEGTWAHRHAANIWTTVDISAESLEKLIEKNDSLPEEQRPAGYPAVFIGFNAAETDDIDAKILLGNIRVKLKPLRGKEYQPTDLSLPSLGIPGFKCSVMNVKNSTGAEMPFGDTFSGKADVYTVKYKITGDTILDTVYELKLEITK